VKTNSQRKKRFKLLLEEQPCSQRSKLKLPLGPIMFLGDKELFLFENMIVSYRKKKFKLLLESI
jgi:hypothetical protein